jgi:hypothetical protein
VHLQGLSSILAALQLQLAGSKRLLQASSLGLHQHRLLDPTIHTIVAACMDCMCAVNPHQNSSPHIIVKSKPCSTWCISP